MTMTMTRAMLIKKTSVEPRALKRASPSKAAGLRRIDLAAGETALILRVVV